jgi:hypothetical protein
LKKQENAAKAETKHHRGHVVKPAVKQEKNQPAEKAMLMPAGEKPQGKKSKRHHRGGKGRSKPPGHKPNGEPSSEASV